MGEQTTPSLVQAAGSELATGFAVNPLVSRGLAHLASESLLSVTDCSINPRWIEFPEFDDIPIQVLLTRVGARLYRIEEIPFLLWAPAESAGYLDVIEAVPAGEEGVLRFVRIVEASGWRTWGAYGVTSPIIIEGKWGQARLRDLEARGGKWWTVCGGMLSLCLPPGLDGNPSQWIPHVEDIEEALRLNPRCADAYYERGLDRAFRGDHENAMKDFDEALRLDPTNAAYTAARHQWAMAPTPAATTETP